MNSAEEILNYENYCALAVSLLSPKLVAPEIAFEKMGINIITDKKLKEKLRWTLYGPKLWRQMEALLAVGFTWSDVADYFGLTYATCLAVHYRAKKKYDKGETKIENY